MKKTLFITTVSLVLLATAALGINPILNGPGTTNTPTQFTNLIKGIAGTVVPTGAVSNNQANVTLAGTFTGNGAGLTNVAGFSTNYGRTAFLDSANGNDGTASFNNSFLPWLSITNASAVATNYGDTIRMMKSLRLYVVPTNFTLASGVTLQGYNYPEIVRNLDQLAATLIHAGNDATISGLLVNGSDRSQECGVFGDQTFSATNLLFKNCSFNEGGDVFAHVVRDTGLYFYFGVEDSYIASEWDFYNFQNTNTVVYSKNNLHVFSQAAGPSRCILHHGSYNDNGSTFYFNGGTGINLSNIFITEVSEGGDAVFNLNGSMFFSDAPSKTITLAPPYVRGTVYFGDLGKWVDLGANQQTVTNFTAATRLGPTNGYSLMTSVDVSAYFTNGPLRSLACGTIFCNVSVATDDITFFVDVFSAGVWKPMWVAKEFPNVDADSSNYNSFNIPLAPYQPYRIYRVSTDAGITGVQYFNMVQQQQ